LENNHRGGNHWRWDFIIKITMALTNTEKREIETLVRKEIKDFMGSSTVKQYEDKLIDMISKEIKRGKLEGDIKDLTLKMFREFYNFMWTQRSYWEPRLKNA
jgi:hypothetical protein